MLCTDTPPLHHLSHLSNVCELCGIFDINHATAFWLERIVIRCARTHSRAVWACVREHANVEIIGPNEPTAATLSLASHTLIYWFIQYSAAAATIDSMTTSVWWLSFFGAKPFYQYGPSIVSDIVVCSSCAHSILVVSFLCCFLCVSFCFVLFLVLSLFCRHITIASRTFGVCEPSFLFGIVCALLLVFLKAECPMWH